MKQYLIQHWVWRQMWHDVVVWEMEPHLFSDFLGHINPCGGDMNRTRVLVTDQPAEYRYLGKHRWEHFDQGVWVEGDQPEVERFITFLGEHPELDFDEALRQYELLDD